MEDLTQVTARDPNIESDVRAMVQRIVDGLFQGDEMAVADAPSDGSPIEKPGCGKRVIRGGAWSFPPHEIRSANRWRDFPSRRSDDTGFRVALDLE